MEKAPDVSVSVSTLGTKAHTRVVVSGLQWKAKPTKRFLKYEGWTFHEEKKQKSGHKNSKAKFLECSMLRFTRLIMASSAQWSTLFRQSDKEEKVIQSQILFLCTLQTYFLIYKQVVTQRSIGRRVNLNPVHPRKPQHARWFSPYRVIAESEAWWHIGHRERGCLGILPEDKFQISAVYSSAGRANTQTPIKRASMLLWSYANQETACWQVPQTPNT